jgi:uncharacterized protein (TIGR03435 family)
MLMLKELPLTFLTCLGLGSVRGAQTLSFDVANIHPHDPGDSRFVVHMPSNGHFAATGAVGKLVLMVAYGVQENQIVGGPSWLDSEKWDIEAKSEDQVHTTEETRAMLQKMLEERFVLRTHREMQQLPPYILTVGRGGPKFKAQPDGRTNYLITGNSISLERGDLAHMAQLLSTALGAPSSTGLDSAESTIYR